VTSHAESDEAQTPEAPTISRRRIVRTAATAAWAVPAIQLATSVPAFAASGCCDLTVTGTGQWSEGELNYVTIPLNISNGCATAVTGLTVVLAVCGLKDITYLGSDVLPPGWVQAGKANAKLDPDGSGCYTLTFMTAQPLAGHTTAHPQFTVKTKAYAGSGNHRPAGTVTAVVSTTGCTASTVIAIPKVG
jgi:hypothetical protein